MYRPLPRHRVAMGAVVAVSATLAWGARLPASQDKLSVPLPREITFRQTSFALAHSEETDEVILVEYTPQGETLDDWTALLAVRYFKQDDLSPRSSVLTASKNVEARRKAGDESANYGIYEDLSTGAWLIDFVMSDYDTLNLSEHNIFFYYAAKKGMVSCQYARRAYHAKAKEDHAWRDDSKEQDAVRALLLSIRDVRYEVFRELSELDLPWDQLAIEVPRGSRNVPTPKMALSFDVDPDQWQMASMSGDEQRIEWTMTRDGEISDPPGESVVHKVAFTTAPLREYVNAWKQQLQASDRKAEVVERENQDGSLTLIFRMQKPYVLGLQRFLKASDAIYMLSYRSGPQTPDQETRSAWSKIVAEATLVPNPERWKHFNTE